MATDDAVTAPYQFSHSLETSVGNAIEHGRAIGGLVRDADVVQGAPPCTLTRAAIESAGTATWLLDGEDQPSGSSGTCVTTGRISSTTSSSPRS